MEQLLARSWSWVVSERAKRQRVVAEWCAKAFGREQATSIPQRAVRLLEEAVEAYQAVGGTPEMAHRLVDYVFSRPPGELTQELGGIGVTLLGLAAAAGVSADEQEEREVAHILTKPLEHFQRRNQEKNDAGFNATAVSATVGPAPRGGGWVDLLEASALTAVERAKAGDVLGRLGDPRFRDDAFGLPADGLLGFVEVPAGQFLMGSDPRRDPQAFDDEQPQHPVDLGRYFVGRFPVTVGQFRCFVAERPLAKGEERAWRDWPENRPVVDVSWHEALAYCDWLTEKLRASPATPAPIATLLRQGEGGSEPWRVTLPSEAEWEKAARGPDGRVYPWGSALDGEHANYDEAGIAAPNAVGCFPRGRSPYGCEEMSGNVWEWTRSRWAGYPYVADDGRELLEGPGTSSCVLRGGAFGNGSRLMRAANRGSLRPGHRHIYFGFRVAVAPSPRSEHDS